MRAKLLLQYHANVNEPDSIGATAVETGADADNFRMVLTLLNHGASIWATDNSGGTMAQSAFLSRLAPNNPEGQALAQVITRLKDAGYPWPPPNPKQVRALRAEGKWPPPQAR
jgi:ankyrin repeat protein